MEPVSIAIITYVSLKFVDQFVKEEGYRRLRKIFFPSKKYKTRFIQIIYETIDEFESVNPIASSENKLRYSTPKLIYVL